MKYRILTWSNSKKWAVRVICDGRVKLDEVKKLTGSPKTGTLLALRKGLAFLKDKVKHDDKVTIELPNAFVYKWIVENSFPKDYAHSLYEIFSLLNALDATVVFRLNKDVTVAKTAKKAEVRSIGFVPATKAADLLTEFA